MAWDLHNLNTLELSSFERCHAVNVNPQDVDHLRPATLRPQSAGNVRSRGNSSASARPVSARVAGRRCEGFTGHGNNAQTFTGSTRQRHYNRSPTSKQEQLVNSEGRGGEVDHDGHRDSLALDGPDDGSAALSKPKQELSIEVPPYTPNGGVARC